MTKKYDYIGPFSNEIEFCLDKLNAMRLLEYSKLPLIKEVNTLDIIELNVSMKEDLSQLNHSLEYHINQLIYDVENLNGSIYAGSSLYEDVSNVSPKRYLTTCLSEKVAKGFLDITSQQIVIGMKDEKKAWEIYNSMVYISPILLAFTASSPYKISVSSNELIDQNFQSIRPIQYDSMCSFLPTEMWRLIPFINSIEKFNNVFINITENVKFRIENNELDINKDEFYRLRLDSQGEEYNFSSFDLLNDSQVFWLVRPRLSHETISKGGDNVMSLEFRAPDLPITKEGMKILNRFTIGLVNFIANYSAKDILPLLNIRREQVFDEFINIGKYGLDYNINGLSVRDILLELLTYSIEGLKISDDLAEASRLQEGLYNILDCGTYSNLIKKESFSNSFEIKDYLIKKLKE